jgi:MFS family permease
MALLIIVVSAASFAATAVNPLQETMREALALTDNQIAVLQGPALALPMIAAAVPLGLLIDRYSRVRLLLALTTFDIVGGALTALSINFAVLLIARCLVGLTALAVAPVGLSLIGDLYAPAQRGRAGMVMSLGQSAGVASSFALGGVLLKLSGTGFGNWRTAMLWLTAPLLLVALTTMAMREPARTGVLSKEPSSRVTWTEFWQYRTLIAPLLSGIVMGQIALGAAYVWAAPMLARRFELTPDRVGEILSIGLLGAGVLGSVLGGTLADLCQRGGGPRRTVAVLSLLSLCSLPFTVFTWAPGLFASTALLLIFITIANSLSVMGTTVFIVAIPNEIRGLSMAVLTAACVVVGTGFAPMMVSLLAGRLGGPAAVGLALALVCAATSAIAAAAFLFGRGAVPTKL